MDTSRFTRLSDSAWRIEQSGRMRVPAIIYADEALIEGMDDKVLQQLTNVASLPGIVKAAYVMPPLGLRVSIGGIAAFGADDGGIISAGGVGFDICCGVRAMLTNLDACDIEGLKPALADALFRHVPAGMGSKGDISLSADEMDAMLSGGARWAIEQGFGDAADLDRIEEYGCADGADAACISEKARNRQRREMGTLGSGNHYLEVQEVAEIFDADAAAAFCLRKGQVIVCIHCGSRGLGHQVGTEYLRDMALAAAEFGITLPDRELACAPIRSAIGQRYLGAMRSATNCALANREIIGHLTRRVFTELFSGSQLDLLYDVSHNTCKAERHRINRATKDVYIHRKGATRSYGPGHPDLPRGLRETGQPVLIGGSMGTGSYVLVGVATSEEKAFSTACHGAGRSMSRHQAYKTWMGWQVADELARQGRSSAVPPRAGSPRKRPAHTRMCVPSSTRRKPRALRARSHG